METKTQKAMNKYFEISAFSKIEDKVPFIVVKIIEQSKADANGLPLVAGPAEAFRSVR